jgi:hypothetical protein
MTESFIREGGLSLRDGLVKMRSLIERGWCQGQPALDANKRFVFPADPTACAWCLGGAAVAVFGTGEGMDLLREIWRAMPADNRPGGPAALSLWNDMPWRTQRDVLAAIDAAVGANEGSN